MACQGSASAYHRRGLQTVERGNDGQRHTPPMISLLRGRKNGTKSKSNRNPNVKTGSAAQEAGLVQSGAEDSRHLYPEEIPRDILLRDLADFGCNLDVRHHRENSMRSSAPRLRKPYSITSPRSSPISPTSSLRSSLSHLGDFFTTKLADHSEIIAILSSGVELQPPDAAPT